jgi:hypothetical protein
VPKAGEICETELLGSATWQTCTFANVRNRRLSKFPNENGRLRFSVHAFLSFSDGVVQEIKLDRLRKT